MGLFKRKRKPDEETENLKAFLDMIAPSIVKFETGYYICGNTFRCIWALREYPTSTDDLAILRHLGEKHGVTLHIYTRMVSPLEERKIVHNAEIRNRMNRGSSQDLQRAVEAESNLQDVANLIGSLHRNKEPLLHCAVYIEMIAGDMQELQILQTNVEVELMRSKLNVDRLKLASRQASTPSARSDSMCLAQSMSASCQQARSQICSHSTIPVKRTEKAFTSGKTSTAATS